MVNSCICEQFLHSRTNYNLVHYYFYILNINNQKARNGSAGNYNPITSEVEVGNFPKFEANLDCREE